MKKQFNKFDKDEMDYYIKYNDGPYYFFDQFKKVIKQYANCELQLKTFDNLLDDRKEDVVMILQMELTIMNQWNEEQLVNEKDNQRTLQEKMRIMKKNLYLMKLSALKELLENRLSYEIEI